MARSRIGKLALLSAAAMLALTAAGYAQTPYTDPEAMRILKSMTDYLAEMKSFSVHTENTLEEELDTGQRVDLDVAVSVTARRPNKLRAVRVGELVDQQFYYDGKTLTMYLPSAGVSATIDAPPTLGEMVDFSREALMIVLPAADLVYTNAYSILTEGVFSAVVVGKAVIGGVACDHLAFRRPDIDFQMWIADEGPPLPHKYVVTDARYPGYVSTVAVFSDWEVNPATDDAMFTFEIPEGITAIEFLVYDEGDALAD